MSKMSELIQVHGAKEEDKREKKEKEEQGAEKERKDAKTQLTQNKRLRTTYQQMMMKIREKNKDRSQDEMIS